MKLFYGFHYRGGRNTSTGRGNPFTGRFSTAGKLKVFLTKQARDEWVDEEIAHATDPGFREAVTKKQARDLCAGWSVEEFTDYIRQEAILLGEII